MWILMITLYALGAANVEASVWEQLIEIEPRTYTQAFKTEDAKFEYGQQITPHFLASQAGLLVHTNNGIAFCGGALISNNYILTAAHCVESATIITVILGAHKIEQEEHTQIRLNATEFKIHEEWSNSTLQNDIALIKLPRPVETNDYIKLGRLPYWNDTSATFETEDCFVSGWTKIGKPPRVSSNLRYIKSPVLKPIECEYEYSNISKKNNICINPNHKGGCIGDSGAPIILEFDFTQVGIVSFGLQYGCEIGKPIVYTRVSEYLHWIDEHSDAVIEVDKKKDFL